MQNDIGVNQFREEQITSPHITVFEQSQQIWKIEDQQLDSEEEQNEPEQEQAEEQQIDQQDDDQHQNQLIQKNELMVSKYQQQFIPIQEDENEELVEEQEQVGAMFLQSINHNNNYFFQASLARFPLQEKEKEIKLQGEIINIECNNNILYYNIETESTALVYKAHVKRRYNDFKLLIKELQVRYPKLILPQIPVGLKYGKLSERDVEERKRILQNCLNILSLHQELVVSQTVRNFLEEEYQLDFEAKRKEGANCQQHSMFDLMNYTVVNKSRQSLQYLKKLWYGSQKLFELTQLEQEIKKLQIQQLNYKNLQTTLLQIQKKQQTITNILNLQDQEHDIFKQVTKLGDCVFNYTDQLNYNTLSLENQYEQFHYAALSIINNILEFLEYVFVYYRQLLDVIYDLNEQQGRVTPNQQISQSIREEVQNYIEAANSQICSSEGIVQKFLQKNATIFQERYLQFQHHIWAYALEKYQ